MERARVPVQQYNLRSANSYIGEGSLHDLNTSDGRPEEIIDRIVDRDAVTEDSLDNDDDSGAVECMDEPYRNSMPLHSIGKEEDQSSLDNNVSSRDPFNIFSIDDVLPIETARARFLDIIVDHFISSHVIDVPDCEVDYTAQSSQDKLSKRKSREVQYEGDSHYVLPLMYVANMYETLVNEVNIRLSSLSGMREKTIGVALEAAGGLYRKVAKKFPRKGPCIFKRRELATSFETRSRFPELVIQEEKRVRFVVVNGLDITEKPTNVHIDNAEWFKSLTGRSEAAVCACDYKFYAPRHKYRCIVSNPVSTIPGLPPFPVPNNPSQTSTVQVYRSVTEERSPLKPHVQSVSYQSQYHPVNQSHQQPVNQHAAQFALHHQCGPPSHLTEVAHSHQSSISQQMACLQPLSHIGGRLHVLPTTPPKFCDECGTPYLRETSKFCSECGVKRLGI